MVRASLPGSILMGALITGCAIPAIASAEELLALDGRSADVRAAHRLKLVPSLRLQISVREPAPVQVFGPPDFNDGGLDPSMFQRIGTRNVDGLSAPNLWPSRRAIGSITLPWRHARLTIGYGPDGSFSLML